MTSPLAGSSYATDQQISSEGVAVELPVAGFVVRVGSAVIDVVVSIVAFVGGVFATTTTLFGISDAVARTAMILLIIGSFVGIPVLLETTLRGRTVGKMIFGLRTVRDDGGPIRFRHALARALVGFIEGPVLMGLPAILSELVDAKSRRIGDFAAGTYVITERRNLSIPIPPSMPPALEPWARSADISALPGGLSIAVHQYLGRCAAMTPEAREQTSARLLDEVLRYVSPLPPPGTRREQVLAAVLAERRRRDLTRLERDQMIRDRLISPDPLRPHRQA